MDLVLSVLNTVAALTLALWVGCLFCFAVLVAPVPFRVLKSREEAGNINAAILQRVESVGLVLGGMTLLAAALPFGLQVPGGTPAGLLAFRLLAVLVMLGCTLADITAIRPRMEQIRAGLGRPLDELPEGAAERVEWARLHRQSVLVFGVALLTGMVAVVLFGWR